MRSSLLALIAIAALFAAPMAKAAPTCQNTSGDTIRCGVAGAMPVRWTLPAEQRARVLAGRTGEPPPNLLGPGLFLIGFFALLALLPDFDGQWDRQEQDEEGQE
jgi:ABC-type amino acid transport substrate-binding protein